MRGRLLYTIILLLAMVLTACREDKPISGKAFIERDVLVELLADLHLVDGVTQDRKFSRMFDADSIDMITPLFDKYGVNRHMFDTTMYMYSRNPALLDAVYNDVLIRLNVMLDANSKEEGANIEEE